MELSFLNSPLLWGLGFASIPIIIHLLYRRKFRRIDWAPMHYLKLSIERNRRRIRLEQLLLLMLRTLAVLLLFFLVARPVMHASGLGSWLGGSSRTNQILLIDDSLSMDYREQGRSALERGRELAAEIVKSVGPKDRFTLLVASQPKQPLLREVELDEIDEIAGILSDIYPTAELVSWEPVFDSIDELIAASTYPVGELTVITDLRRAGWDDKLSELGNRWAGRRLRMRVFDVGSGRSGNVALEELQQIGPLAAVGATVTWEAVIRNGADKLIDGVDAHFTVDGKPSVVRLPPLEPGVVVNVPLTATFQVAGTHHVTFELPADDLPGDNRRQAVVNVKDRVDLVLVDGEPSSERLGGEVDLLALSLALGVNEAEAFRIRVLTDSEWAALPADNCDLLVLANVATLSAEQVTKLERQVRDGAGLMIFVGDQIDPLVYNHLLYRDGAGLLPAALETIAEEEISGLVVESGSPSPLDALLQLKAAVLKRIKVQKHYQVRLPSQAGDVRVLARWNNANASPAVIGKSFGRGHVLLWTITADKQWSTWPLEPSYVLAMREAAVRIVRTDAATHNLTAGDLIQQTLARGKHALDATVETPDGERPQPARVEDERAITFDQTRYAGFYKLAWQEPPTTNRAELFAINPDHRESSLERIGADELRGLWGAFQPEVITATAAGDTPLAVRGQEIWRPLALLLIGLFAIESALATWTGRQR